jgi:hypothetical protein
MARKKLGEILIQAGVMDQAGLRAALVEQRRWGGQLGRILVDMKLINEDTLVQALSHQLNFPVVNLDKQAVSPEAIELVPVDLADQHRLIPFNLEGKFLDVAMSDPTNLGIIDELRIRTQLNVRPYLAGPHMIERALARYYKRGRGMLGLGGPSYGAVDAIELDRGDGAARVAGAAAPPPRHATPTGERDAEIFALQERISKLEALVVRDEDVLRKVLGLLVEKGVATREEILERIK